MRTSIAIAATAAGGYLVGCVPVAGAVARRHGVEDLRTSGDRNPGYWNARELLGARAALPVFVGDVAKGAAGAALGRLLGRRLGDPWWLVSIGGGAAMVGHAAPVTGGFRGGRGVLAFVGASLVGAPEASALAIAATAVTWAVTCRFDVAARVGVAAFPVVQLAVDGARRTAASGLLMTFVGARFALAHRSARR